jgi:hypothetical protein
MNFRDLLMYKYVLTLQVRTVPLFNFHFRLKAASFFLCLEMSHDKKICGVYRIVTIENILNFS